MTGDEMERAIEFLLESRANAEVRQQRTDEQIAETSRQLQAYAQTQSEFIEIATRNMSSLAETQARIQANIPQLAESQQHTDE